MFDLFTHYSHPPPSALATAIPRESSSLFLVRPSFPVPVPVPSRNAKLFRPFTLVPGTKSPGRNISCSSSSSSPRRIPRLPAVIFPAPLHPRPPDEIHSLRGGGSHGLAVPPSIFPPLLPPYQDHRAPQKPSSRHPPPRRQFQPRRVQQEPLQPGPSLPILHPIP